MFKLRHAALYFFWSLLPVVCLSALSAAVPSKSDKIVKKLENGTLLIVQKNQEPKKGLSARVLAKRSAGSSRPLSLSQENSSSLWPLFTTEKLTLAYDDSSQDLQKLDQFLTYCCERFGKTKSQFPIDYQHIKKEASWIDQNNLRPQPLQKELESFSISQVWETPIVVICGDLSTESITKSAETSFAKLRFAPAAQPKTSLRLLSSIEANPISHIGITYPLPTTTKEESLLTQGWKGLIAAKILSKRLSENSSTPASLILPAQSPIPTTTLSFVFKAQEPNATDLADDIISHIEMHAAEPVLFSEFKAAKEHALERLAQIRNQVHGARTPDLASYLLAMAQLGEEKTDLSQFVRKSQEILQNLSFPAFQAEFPLLFVSPSQNGETPIAASFPSASRKRRVASHQASTETDPYYTLPITEKEKEMIHTIISTMAEHNVISLAFKRNELDNLGKKIHHVHPMRFLGTVFSQAYLKKCMKDILDSHFKWNGFIDGFGARMDGEADRHNLHRYSKGLCKSIRADHDLISSYIDHRNWEGLVKHLIHN